MLYKKGGKCNNKIAGFKSEYRTRFERRCTPSDSRYSNSAFRTSIRHDEHYESSSYYAALKNRAVRTVALSVLQA